MWKYAIRRDKAVANSHYNLKTSSMEKGSQFNWHLPKQLTSPTIPTIQERKTRKESEQLLRKWNEPNAFRS